MTGIQVIYSLIGVVVGAMLTATFNLLLDRRRRRAANLAARRLVRGELITGRDDLAFMIASRTWKRVRVRFSKWEELENEFTGVVREKDLQLVRPAFGVLEVVDEFARNALAKHDTSANEIEKLLGAPLSVSDIDHIEAVREVVEKAVIALGGPPESGAAIGLAERMRQQQENVLCAREEMRRAAGKFIRLAAAEADVQPATNAAPAEGLDANQNENISQASRMVTGQVTR